MKIRHFFKNFFIFSRSRRRWVHRHRIRLRGADWQAENMAVPFAICEKSLLRIPKNDLRRLMSSWKQYFRFVQESRGYASTDYHKSDIEHSARIQHAYSSSSRSYSSRDRDLGESCDLRCQWVTMILKDRHLTKFSKFSRSQPHKEWMCSLLSSYIISLCYPEYNFILSSFFSLLFLSFFFSFFTIVPQELCTDNGCENINVSSTNKNVRSIYSVDSTAYLFDACESRGRLLCYYRMCARIRVCVLVQTRKRTWENELPLKTWEL